MKKIFNYISDLFDAVMIARKATCLARAGKYKDIKNLYDGI
jgi:hypothetical protein